MRDAYTWSDADFKFWGLAPATKGKRSAVEPLAIILTRDSQSLSQLARPVRKARKPSAPAPPFVHADNTAQRLESPDKDATGFSFTLRHDIETFVHSVDKVDVGAACGPEHDSRPLREAARSVSSQVFQTQISFCFDDHTGRRIVQDYTA